MLYGEDNLWLYGAPAVGKTHATHILVSELERAILVTDAEYDLIGLESFATVVLDGIEQWVGDVEKEKTIFALYEQLLHAQNRLVVTSRSNLEELDFALLDLRSRMSMFSRFQMLPLPFSEQPDFLRVIATKYGLTLSKEVAQFLLRHLTRSQAGLVRAMARLNTESIVRKRPISVPFVKEVFGI